MWIMWTFAMLVQRGGATASGAGLEDWVNRLGPGGIGVVVGLYISAKWIHGPTIARLLAMLEQWNQAALARMTASE